MTYVTRIRQEIDVSGVRYPRIREFVWTRRNVSHTYPPIFLFQIQKIELNQALVGYPTILVGHKKPGKTLTHVSTHNPRSPLPIIPPDLGSKPLLLSTAAHRTGEGDTQLPAHHTREGENPAGIAPSFLSLDLSATAAISLPRLEHHDPVTASECSRRDSTPHLSASTPAHTHTHTPRPDQRPYEKGGGRHPLFPPPNGHRT